MKLLFLTIFMLMLCQWGDAFGDNDARGGGNNINNILQRCISPGIPRASLSVDPQTGRVTPVPSRFLSSFPKGRIIPSADTQVRLFNMLPNYDMRIQTIVAPTQTVVPVDQLQFLCNFTQIQQNEERINYENYLGITINRYQEEGITGSNLAIEDTDVQVAYNRTLENLDCRVDIDWVDGGPALFPRYYMSGSCRARRCSMPDRSNFLCRPDLTNQDQMRSLPAFRWDCCWTGRMFECGWRQFTLPIVCDCDCDCGAEEVPGGAPPAETV